METKVSSEGSAGTRAPRRGDVSETCSLSDADVGAGAEEHRGADEDAGEPVKGPSFCWGWNKDVNSPPLCCADNKTTSHFNALKCSFVGDDDF